MTPAKAGVMTDVGVGSGAWLGPGAIRNPTLKAREVTGNSGPISLFAAAGFVDGMVIAALLSRPKSAPPKNAMASFGNPKPESSPR